MEKKMLSHFLILMILILPLDCYNFTYSTHDERTSFLKEFTSQHSELTHLYSIGKSVEGRDLWVVAVSTTPAEHVLLKPEFKYVGGIHGNECVSIVLMVTLIEYLVTEYEAGNKEIVDMLTNTRIHIMPSMNPDGFESVFVGKLDWGKYLCDAKMGRYNAQNLDLNRNFPDPWMENMDAFPRAPETQALMDWLTQYQFVLSAAMHGGELVVNYPYDNGAGILTAVYSKSPDDDVFIDLAKAYSFAHPTMKQHAQFKDGITNGAKWYPVIGGMQDYNYIYSGCMELTLELGHCKFPLDEELEGEWDDHRMSLLTLINKIHIGIKGTVQNATGYPVEGASVYVKGRDAHPLNSTQLGEFWKLLLPGTYTLIVDKEGFHRSERKVTVTSGDPAQVTITLLAASPTLSHSLVLLSSSIAFTFLCIKK